MLAIFAKYPDTVLFPGIDLQEDLIELIVSIVIYVILFAALDDKQVQNAENIWENFEIWNHGSSDLCPDSWQALMNARSFLKEKLKRIPFLHKRLGLGIDFKEAAARMLHQSYGHFS